MPAASFSDNASKQIEQLSVSGVEDATASTGGSHGGPVTKDTPASFDDMEAVEEGL